MVLVSILGTAAIIAGSLYVSELIVGPDFTIHANPNSEAILVSPSPSYPSNGSNESSGGYFNISLTGIRAFNGVITVRALPPPGVTVSFPGQKPEAIPLADSPQSLTLIVNAAFVDNYTFQVIATSGRLSHSVTLSINVQGLTIRADRNPLVLNPGSSGTIDLTLISRNRFTDDLRLGCSTMVGACPFTYGVRIGLPLGTIHLPPGGSVHATLTVLSDNYFSSTGSSEIDATTRLGVVTTNLQIVMNESLALQSNSFNSPTNVTLNLLNNGPTEVEIAGYQPPSGYSVSDSVGDQYVSGTSSLCYGPVTIACNTLPPNNVTPIVILIGDGYLLVAGNPFTFQPGHYYTVSIETKRNNTFSFTIFDP
jgi:hypothetical protein